jgi:hypothetical protein
MTKYTPAWKGDDGNRVVTPDPKLIFNTEAEALTSQHFTAPIYAAMGLQPDGALPFEVEKMESGATRGLFAHVHIEGVIRVEFLAVSGPAMEETTEADRCEGIGIALDEQRGVLN